MHDSLILTDHKLDIIAPRYITPFLEKACPHALIN